MARISGFLLIVLLLISCGNEVKNKIDVSVINVNVTVDRFEEKFYTTSEEDLPKLKSAYAFMFANVHDSTSLRKMKSEEELFLFDQSKKVFGKYTPLDMVAINDWFNNHTDAILVTDKINEPLIFSELFVDKSRLMMELFDEESLQKGLKSKILSAMPSQSIIDNMKIKDVEKFAQKGVKNIAISRRFILQNKLLLKEFKKFGIKPFVYHINFDPGINEDYVVKYEMDFIYGIYADEWKFK